MSARDREESAREREESAREREESGRDREESARFREALARGLEAREQQAARERQEMNKRWGELANKMGTVVEDIVAPSIRRLAREMFDCGELRQFWTRMSASRGDDPSRTREFDALYVGTRAVLLNETKSSPRASDARRFAAFLESGEFARYFPQYRELPIVPAFSSLSIPADLVTYLTRRGIYAIAMGDEAMQVLNRDAVRRAGRPHHPAEQTAAAAVAVVAALWLSRARAARAGRSSHAVARPSLSRLREEYTRCHR